MRVLEFCIYDLAIEGIEKSGAEVLRVSIFPL